MHITQYSYTMHIQRESPALEPIIRKCSSVYLQGPYDLESAFLVIQGYKGLHIHFVCNILASCMFHIGLRIAVSGILLDGLAWVQPYQINI